MFKETRKKRGIDDISSSSSDISHDARKAKKDERKSRRKRRAYVARQTLRQMNAIGLDNVDGFTPEILIKKKK